VEEPPLEVEVFAFPLEGAFFSLAAVFLVDVLSLVAERALVERTGFSEVIVLVGVFLGLEEGVLDFRVESGLEEEGRFLGLLDLVSDFFSSFLVTGPKEYRQGLFLVNSLDSTKRVSADLMYRL